LVPQSIYREVPPNKKFIEVFGSKMAYVDEGSGDPIVFLHGNPTSSYLWREIIPRISPKARCIALDLIGMGDSDKLEGPEERYDFVQHKKFLEEFMKKMHLNANITLVLHDWGSALGFDWAFHHQKSMKGIAYLESILKPMSMSELDFQAKLFFQTMRSSWGDLLILKLNIFVDYVLPYAVLRKLSVPELENYRKPFLEPGEGRRTMLSWPRQIPFDGEPAEVYQVLERYSSWLQNESQPIPKLFINVEPGFLTPFYKEFARSLPNQREVVVKGLHYAQEDSPHQIAEAVKVWYSTLK